MSNPLIVAIDVPTFDEAQPLIDELIDEVGAFKIGSQLFTACGPFVVRYIQAKGKKVFLDLKFHDIPNTVANAVRSAVNLSHPGHSPADEKGQPAGEFEPLFMLTVHIQGGAKMLEAAAQAAKEQAAALGTKPPAIVGITVLTSDANADNILDTVLQRAKLAKQSGLDGIVCSSNEAQAVRQEMGEDFIIVTPGIRPLDADAGDQERIATPTDALRNGSNYLVVGRPIVKANSPIESAKKIKEEIKSVSN